MNSLISDGDVAWLCCPTHICNTSSWIFFRSLKNLQYSGDPYFWRVAKIELQVWMVGFLGGCWTLQIGAPESYILLSISCMLRDRRFLASLATIFRSHGPDTSNGKGLLFWGIIWEIARSSILGICLKGWLVIFNASMTIFPLGFNHFTSWCLAG